jgi:hypothetical protein
MKYIKKQNNYRQASCCHNCNHCFILTEYDDPDTYYCTFKASKRPLCGSMALNESYFIDGKSIKDKEYQRKILQLINTWNRWAKQNEVESDYICDDYIMKEIINEHSSK